MYSTSRFPKRLKGDPVQPVVYSSHEFRSYVPGQEFRNMDANGFIEKPLQKVTRRSKGKKKGQMALPDYSAVHGPGKIVVVAKPQGKVKERDVVMFTRQSLETDIEQIEQEELDNYKKEVLMKKKKRSKDDDNDDMDDVNRTRSNGSTSKNQTKSHSRTRILSFATVAKIGSILSQETSVQRVESHKMKTLGVASSSGRKEKTTTTTSTTTNPSSSTKPSTNSSPDTSSTFDPDIFRPLQPTNHIRDQEKEQAHLQSVTTARQASPASPASPSTPNSSSKKGRKSRKRRKYKALDLSSTDNIDESGSTATRQTAIAQSLDLISSSNSTSTNKNTNSALTYSAPIATTSLPNTSNSSNINSTQTTTSSSFTTAAIQPSIAACSNPVRPSSVTDTVLSDQDNVSIVTAFSTVPSSSESYYSAQSDAYFSARSCVTPTQSHAFRSNSTSPCTPTPGTHTDVNLTEEIKCRDHTMPSALDNQVRGSAQTENDVQDAVTYPTADNTLMTYTTVGSRVPVSDPPIHAPPQRNGLGRDPHPSRHGQSSTRNNGSPIPRSIALAGHTNPSGNNQSSTSLGTTMSASHSTRFPPGLPPPGLTRSAVPLSPSLNHGMSPPPGFGHVVTAHPPGLTPLTRNSPVVSGRSLPFYPPGLIQVNMNHTPGLELASISRSTGFPPATPLSPSSLDLRSQNDLLPNRNSEMSHADAEHRGNGPAQTKEDVQQLMNHLCRDLRGQSDDTNGNVNNPQSQSSVVEDNRQTSVMTRLSTGQGHLNLTPRPSSRSESRSFQSGHLAPYQTSRVSSGQSGRDLILATEEQEEINLHFDSLSLDQNGTTVDDDSEPEPSFNGRIISYKNSKTGRARFGAIGGPVPSAEDRARRETEWHATLAKKAPNYVVRGDDQLRRSIDGRPEPIQAGPPGRRPSVVSARASDHFPAMQDHNSMTYADRFPDRFPRLSNDAEAQEERERKRHGFLRPADTRRMYANGDEPWQRGVHDSLTEEQIMLYYPLGPPTGWAAHKGVTHPVTEEERARAAANNSDPVTAAVLLEEIRDRETKFRAEAAIRFANMSLEDHKNDISDREYHRKHGHPRAVPLYQPKELKAEVTTEELKDLPIADQINPMMHTMIGNVLRYADTTPGGYAARSGWVFTPEACDLSEGGNKSFFSDLPEPTPENAAATQKTNVKGNAEQKVFPAVNTRGNWRYNNWAAGRGRGRFFR